MKNNNINSLWNEYHVPSSIDEAVGLLERYAGGARLVGGGTDLLLDIRQGRCPAPRALVDPTRIPGLGDITAEDGFIVIGCGVSHAAITRSRRVRRHGSCLAEGCGVIGGPQVRNVATLAGNVAHAMPAADGTIGLLALGGEVETADAAGRRWMPLADAFLGPGKSAIDHRRTLLTRLRFRPTGKESGSAFHRVMRPQGVALPMIAMAARLRLGSGRAIESVSIAIGPAGPVPYLAENAMAYLEGKTPDEAHFGEAARVALDGLQLRDSKYRASREYREEMIRLHLPGVLARAAGRAEGGHAMPGEGAS